MKHLLTTLTLMPALALAHGNHQQTHHDGMHGLLHMVMSLEGVVVISALGTAVYFIFKK
jgi:hypothetical protein